MMKDLRSLLQNDVTPVSAVVDMLSGFNYKLLINSEVKVRKTALVKLFTILSLISKGDGKIVAVPPSQLRNLDVPLVIVEDIIYLAIESANDILFKTHSTLFKSISGNANLFKTQLFVFQKKGEGKEKALFGVNKEKLLSIQDLESNLEDIPDPLKTVSLCSNGKILAGAANFRFLRVGGGEEDVPSCSTSVSDSDDESASKGSICENPLVESALASNKKKDPFFIKIREKLQNRLTQDTMETLMSPSKFTYKESHDLQVTANQKNISQNNMFRILDRSVSRNVSSPKDRPITKSKIRMTIDSTKANSNSGILNSPLLSNASNSKSPTRKFKISTKRTETKRSVIHK